MDAVSLALWLGLGLPGAGILDAGQAEPPSSARIQIEIGKATVHALDLPKEVHLPITFAPGGMTGVTRLRLELGFADNLLSFIDATSGASATRSNANIKATTRIGKKGERVLIVDVVAPKELSPGPLMTLAFEVLRPAMVADEIPLKTIHASAQGSSATRMAARVAGGTITVDASPVPTCFFYMH